MNQPNSEQADGVRALEGGVHQAELLVRPPELLVEELLDESEDLPVDVVDRRRQEDQRADDPAVLADGAFAVRHGMPFRWCLPSRSGAASRAGPFRRRPGVSSIAGRAPAPAASVVCVRLARSRWSRIARRARSASRRAQRQVDRAVLVGRLLAGRCAWPIVRCRCSRNCSATMFDERRQDRVAARRGDRLVERDVVPQERLRIRPGTRTSRWPRR